MINTYKKGLTSREAYLISSLARLDKDIFSIEDAKKVCGAKAKQLTHALAKKKWLLPLKRGMYAIVPLDIGVEGADHFILHSFVIASHLVEPYYIGYWSALNHHGLTSQIPRAVFICTTKAKRSLTIFNDQYKFVKVADRKFFGFEEVELDHKRVFISDINKTVVDCLDHPEHAGGIDEVAMAIYFGRRELDFSLIKKYALRAANMTILKRLAYILWATGLSAECDLSGVVLSKGYPLLDPLSLPKGKHSRRWGLVLNCTLDKERWMY